MKTKTFAFVFAALLGTWFIATAASAAAFWTGAAENVATCATCRQ